MEQVIIANLIDRHPKLEAVEHQKLHQLVPYTICSGNMYWKVPIASKGVESVRILEKPTWNAIFIDKNVLLKILLLVQDYD